jgi:hypothetical protein
MGRAGRTVVSPAGDNVARATEYNPIIKLSGCIGAEELHLFKDYYLTPTDQS